MLNDYELLYYCYQQNESSFNLLAAKYERYIYYIINLYKKRYYFFAYEDIDLYNEGLILLYDCIFSYRDDLDVRFSSYFLACLKRRYLFLIRNLANNKNKTHALAISLDYCPGDSELDLYSVIDNQALSVSEQVYHNDLIEKTLTVLVGNLNEMENKIIYYYLQSYRYNEIARLLNIDLKKIDNTVQKYKKLVKKG